MLLIAVVMHLGDNKAVTQISIWFTTLATTLLVRYKIHSKLIKSSSLNIKAYSYFTSISVVLAGLLWSYATIIVMNVTEYRSSTLLALIYCMNLAYAGCIHYINFKKYSHLYFWSTVIPTLSYAAFSKGLYFEVATIVLVAVFYISGYLEKLRERCVDQIKYRVKTDELNKKLKTFSETDPLTGLKNRFYLNNSLDAMLLKAKEEKKTITAIMIDIDCFKLYNDHYGHLSGDKIIKMIANILQHKFSGLNETILCRFGGEEFLILSLDEEIKSILDSLCESVADLQVPHVASRCLPIVTISVGCNSQEALKLFGHDIENLIDGADKALYLAKANGRNQIIFSS